MVMLFFPFSMEIVSGHKEVSIVHLAILGLNFYDIVVLSLLF